MSSIAQHDQAVSADRVKERHRRMWALGDYPAVASEVSGRSGPSLSRPATSSPGTSVLDVAAGNGNASIPAALCGARGVATRPDPRAARGRAPSARTARAPT